MARTIARSKSANTQLGVGVRGRDAEFPSAPARVTGDAQAKLIDINTFPRSDFSQLPRDKLPERPSTSGGPAANSSLRRQAEKRETRDDLHFNPLGVHGKGTTFYNFPLPGSLPTPASTPKSSLPPRKSSLAGSGSFTPESMEAVSANMNVPQMEIGMALGSPTHQPNTWQSHVPVETSTGSPSPDPINNSMDGWVSTSVPTKQKSMRWNSLRGFFRGKKDNASSQQPFYQLQPERTITTTVEPDYVNFEDLPPSSEKKLSKSRVRGRTNSERKTEKHKPEMKRAQTAPLDFDFQDSSRGRTKTGNPQIMLDGGPIVDNVIQSDHSGHRQGGLMLDVDIPSIYMERYSIMFGSLLQKPATTSSSLLARRQATLDKLKTVNEALASKERELEEKAKQLRPRRSTSPQPTRSPAFSLFPSTPSRLTVRHGSTELRRSPLQRSNTSPAALSPSRPSFAPGSDNEAHITLLSAAPVAVAQAQAQHSSNHKPSQKKQDINQPSKPASNNSPKPQHITRNWLSEQSHLTIDSPVSDVEMEQEDIYDPVPLPAKLKLEEPTWHMIKPHHEPTHSAAGSSSSGSDHSTSNSASSISSTSTPHSASSTHKTVHIQSPPSKIRSRSTTTTAVIHARPSEVSNSEFGSPSLSAPNKTTNYEEDEHEQRLKTAADVSIARQISVSRQQRQLLIPIKTSSASSLKKNNQNFPSPLNINRLASPLSAVAAGESPVTGNAGGPLMEIKDAGKGNPKERLLDAPVKQSTPTLVVVGSGEGEREKMWSGERKVGLAERRKGREVGEIKVGLAVGDGKGHEHRKSERVVVERVSVASSH